MLTCCRAPLRVLPPTDEDLALGVRALVCGKCGQCYEWAEAHPSPPAPAGPTAAAAGSAEKVAAMAARFAAGCAIFHPADNPNVARAPSANTGGSSDPALRARRRREWPRGVNWLHRKRAFRARLWLAAEKRWLYLGLYKTVKAAALAIEEARAERGLTDEGNPR